MGVGLIIRPFIDSDFSGVTKYFIPEEQAIYTTLPIDVIEAAASDINEHPFVVYFGDYLIGFFALNELNKYTSNRNAILFKSFSIDSHFQKMGFALKVLKLLPEIMKRKFPNKDEIILTVHHTNRPAINLYIKAGLVDKGLRYEGEHGEELIFHLNVLN